MKAPFIPYQKDGFHDEPFEGTLYYGGDKGDFLNIGLLTPS